MRARALPALVFKPPRPRVNLTLDIPGSRLLVGLGLAMATVGALEYSSFGRALQAGLTSLELDRDRVAVIAAWIFCVLVALIGGLLTSRPWPSALAAVGYLSVTFAVPWTSHMLAIRPVLFGSPEHLNVMVLVRSLVTVAAVSFLLAVPAAGLGRLLAELVSVPDEVPFPRLPLRAVLLAAFTGALLVSVQGAETVLRYGPSHQVYVPTARGANSVAGQVLVRTFYSKVRGADLPLAVYLPPSYRLAPNLRYPVVYLLHGSPGSYRDWLNLGVARISDAGITSGSLAESILVIPDGNGTLNRPTQWADSIDGQERVESSMVELASFVDREYRTMADRRHRVVAGLSEGGFGAANLASRHPDLFGVAISLSGYFKADGAVFGQNPAFIRANSPTSIIREDPAARSVRFILVAGEGDAQYLRNAEAFAAELDRWGVAHSLFRLPGAHEGGVWINGLILGLEQVKPQLEERPR